MSTTLPTIFCAIDTPDIDHAKNLINQIVPAGCGVKLGLEFFNSFGPDGIQDIIDSCNNPPIFLDLKYYDIPNTVAGAVRAASKLGVAYLNVHASGGLDMMKAAKDACAGDTKLLAVTILTSFDEPSIQAAGYQAGIQDRVVQLATLTQEAGLNGIVCSSHEIEAIRMACGNNFVLMVPGIRPAGSSADDQKRIMTPKEAIDKGATHLVIGRPITKADNPAQAAKDIIQTL
ncbi:MAG: orotidine-5'-phosphate decarboxylase [Micavibrio sp.]|nr:orotidine-5'-phosphate decarboxylase [Micavibrio sp.]